MRHRLAARAGATAGLTLLLAIGTAVAAPAEIRFAPAAERWGLDFHHHDGGSGRLYMVETNGAGVVLFDFDGDGDLDVFWIDGAALPGYEGPPPGSRLFRNDGGGFVDVTAAAGLDVPAYGTGGVAGDIDGDGDLDLAAVQTGATPVTVFEQTSPRSFSVLAILASV